MVMIFKNIKYSIAFSKNKHFINDIMTLTVPSVLKIETVQIINNRLIEIYGGKDVK